MIHYHGTPAGGSQEEAARFLAGRHAFIPFPESRDLEVAEEVCESFAFDNGAFSVWRSGGQLDIPAYQKWCEEWAKHPAFDWAVIPDIIDGSEADNNALVLDWDRSVPGVPVWHFHESLERLDTLCSDFLRVALGSSGQWPTPGTDGWWGRACDAMEVICIDGKPRCKLHGLRMLNPEIFRHLPLASADSTNAVRNSGSYSRFGSYLPIRASTRAAVIAERIESFQSASIWAGKLPESSFWECWT